MKGTKKNRIFKEDRKADAREYLHERRRAYTNNAEDEEYQTPGPMRRRVKQRR